MTETTPEPVEVHVLGADMAEAARLLLDAAADLGHAPEVVETIGGGFVVPRAVAEKAGALDAEIRDPEDDDEPEHVEGERTPFAGGPDTATVTNAVDTGDVDPADTPAGPPTDGAAEQPVDLTTEGEATATAATAAAATDVPAEDAEVLRGEALDQALKDRGLPTSGTADEKRARVAEHDAAQQ